MNEAFNKFEKRITGGNNFRLFLLKNLPAAWIAGCRLKAVSPHEAIVTVKQSWLNQNPFGSMYFAVLNMAAELSTGVLCMGYLYEQPPCSMLVVKQNAHYHKKATGSIRFVCSDGERIAQTVAEAIETLEPIIVDCSVKAFNADNDLVAEMQFSWRFKSRNLQRGRLA